MVSLSTGDHDCDERIVRPRYHRDSLEVPLVKADQPIELLADVLEGQPTSVVARGGPRRNHVWEGFEFRCAAVTA